MKNLQSAKTVAREVYAWPGGYPLFLVTSDGGCLCPACVKSQWRSIAGAALSHDINSGWHPEGHAINFEDPDLYCDHCGKQIEAAYV